ncbi:MAG: D-glycero-beta-D-manno-heptose 1-phosphate adenylyltransferase [Desulfobulbaceae bacterium]|nr:D-glycero-beta-D-manno-heptose 1-phosphate adenylyltransferase [Desulfobulbaceae bacterium]
MKYLKNPKNQTDFSLPVFGGFLQIDVLSDAPDKNLARVRDLLVRLAPPPNALIVLPELWSAGFFYEGLAAQAALTGEMLAALAELAVRYQICLAGSLPEKLVKPGRISYCNTLYFSGPDGVLGVYRKQQLFAPMEENRYFQPGDTPLPVSTPWGLIGGLVCFDLRFPELAREQLARGAKVLVVSAQWPAARQDQWRILLQARAIENQAFVIACNRCGITGDTVFAGHSMVVAPNGMVLAEAGEGEECGRAELDRSLLSDVRAAFQTTGKTPYLFQDQEKICELDRLQEKIACYQEAGRKMVFTNGCFDILHEGHVTYLEAARREGDYLVVGLNSDESIRAIKGPDRPVNSETSRARLLAALGCVDHVVLFGEETPHRLITTLMPDVLIKGADWPVEQIVGAKEVLAAGGEVKTIELVGDFSTTGLIKKIRKL